MQELLDFDVAIEPLGDGYRARVIGSPAGEAYADFALPFTDENLTILILRVTQSIGRARRKIRRIQSEERRLLEDFGDQLFQAVFSGAVRECLEGSRRVAGDRDAGLRIRLRLPGALANIPWEYLYENGYGFLGLSPETALVRYLAIPAPVRPFPISPPLRILAMISAPTDVPGLAGEEEWSKLTTALDDLIRGGLVEVDRLEAGTLSALQRPLRLGEYHVLHFIGHGGWDEDAQDGALAVEGVDGQARLVTGRDLGLMIRGHRSLRLVVLNACEGARSAKDDPFGGVAQALVRQGIPAVIAMQFEISDPAALVFSQSFYQAIADGLPVDVATLEARRAMFAEGNEVEWATPVLYLRSPDGRVFTKTRSSPAERQARDLAKRYTLARAAADAQDWDQALTAFTMIADIDPGYRDVAAQLAECRRRRDIAAMQEQTQREAQEAARQEAEEQTRKEAERQAREETERQAGDLANHYALARAAEDVQDWDQALRAFTMIADIDPGYQDVQQRADNARKQQLIARLRTEVRNLHQAGQWAAVVKVGERLRGLDPVAADPAGLVTSARAELAAAEEAERQASEKAGRQARREAEEQARREAEEAARQKAEEEASADHPKLELSTLAVDFGRIRVGGKIQPRHVRVLHGGNLNVRITSAPEWIQAQHSGDTLTLRPDPKAPGSLVGHVQIDSYGGSARIRVTATVDSPVVPDTRGYYQGDRLATWGQRVGAFLIDWLPLIPGIVIWSVGAGKHLGAIVAVGVLATVPLWLYNRWYLQGRTGQSWGKRAMSLKLIGMSDREPIGGWKAAIRDLAHYLDFLILYVGFLLPIWDARRQTLADKATRTIVISLKA